MLNWLRGADPFSFLTMFSSLGLFSQVDCPEGSYCCVPRCIFAHRKASKNHESPLPAANAPKPSRYSIDSTIEDGPRKRRKVSDPNETPTDTTSVCVPETLKNFSSSTPVKQAASLKEITKSHVQLQHGTPLPSSLLRPVSPPPQRVFKGNLGDAKPNHIGSQKPLATPIGKTKDTQLDKQPKTLKTEALNPRKLPNPPAGHPIRVRLVNMMHDQVVRLNEEVKKSDDASKIALELSTQEMIHTVLSEEESIAKKNPSVYTNVLKNRIGVLKKMTLPAWKTERLKAIENELEKPATTIAMPKPKSIETGLSRTEEIVVLPFLINKQDGLEKHGYVTAQPSAAEIDKARQGVEAAHNWEQCDRCQTRFQVFPGRRAEDGALTTGGQCRYHPAKPRRPNARDKADKGVREPVYSCCNEVVGTSIGCTTGETHVYRISDPKRLALVMPFEATPESPSLNTDAPAVCFDCEMCYTTYGMELVRLTATSWPYGAVLLDTLVRPLGEILDLNSRFSGVWPSDFTNAALFFSLDRPSSQPAAPPSTPPMAFASSPAVARSQLFDLITPTTPLIGHALENDLNTTRIIHPTIIDTCLLFPHPKGLPIRYGLKALMKNLLDRDVQVQDGGKGHDSAEDARSAGDLVRYRIGGVWNGMRTKGWKIKGGLAVEPSNECVVHADVLKVAKGIRS